MNWDAISAISEVIGAIAVVISLLYVAFQIRSQTITAKLAALHELARSQRAASTMFASTVASDIFVRANESLDTLSEAESVQLVIMVTNLFRAWENAFLENQEGHLEDHVWETWSRDYARAMGAPSFQKIWALRRANYHRDFQSYVDSIEAEEYITR